MIFRQKIILTMTWTNNYQRHYGQQLAEGGATDVPPTNLIAKPIQKIAKDHLYQITLHPIFVEKLQKNFKGAVSPIHNKLPMGALAKQRLFLFLLFKPFNVFFFFKISSNLKLKPCKMSTYFSIFIFSNNCKRGT